MGIDNTWLAYQIDMAAALSSLKTEEDQDHVPADADPRFGKLVGQARVMEVPESGVW